MPKLLLTNRNGTSAKGGPGSGPKPGQRHPYRSREAIALRTEASDNARKQTEKAGQATEDASEHVSGEVKDKLTREQYSATMHGQAAHRHGGDDRIECAADSHTSAHHAHEYLAQMHADLADMVGSSAAAFGHIQASHRHELASSAHRLAARHFQRAKSADDLSRKRLIIKGGPGSGPKPHGGLSHAAQQALAASRKARSIADRLGGHQTAEEAVSLAEKGSHIEAAERHHSAADDHDVAGARSRAGSPEKDLHEKAARAHRQAAAAHENARNGKPEKSFSEFVEGKAVSFLQDEVRVAGQVVKHLDTGKLSVRLAMPFDGKLCLTDSEFEVSEDALESENFEFVAKRVQAFEDIIPFEMDSKSIILKDEKGVVEDYRDVRIAGMASTFKEITPKDREGDYVIQGAFNRTLKQFMQNPVMLRDHKNDTDSLVGSYTKVEIRDSGLYVEGMLSNAPAAKSIRFLVAEKHLKAFSMGGFFQYGKDAKGIEEVELFEISLTPIPMNPDSLFQVRSVGIADAVKCWKGHQKTFKHGGK